MRDAPPARRLLRAEQVRRMLGVDRSTIYRMAGTGRLPAVKIGRQWRFPAGQIEMLFAAHGGGLEPRSPAGRPALLLSVRPALPVLDVTAKILGVMMVLTGMSGEPLTGVVNPCPWFTGHSADPDLLATCTEDWKRLAGDPDFGVLFRAGPLRFDRVRAFIRVGSRLVGMLVAGGIAAGGEEPRALCRLGAEGRARVLAALPVVAAGISGLAAGCLSDSDVRSMA